MGSVPLDHRLSGSQVLSLAVIVAVAAGVVVLEVILRCCVYCH